MTSLNRIQLRGFKSIRELDLHLESLNVLIGANGAGKSNFIALFRLMNQIMEGNLQIFVGKSGGANTLLYSGQKTTDEIFIRLYFGESVYTARLVPAAPDTLIFAEEVCQTGALEVILGDNSRESGLAGAARNRTDRFGQVILQLVETFKDWKVYHFQDTSESARIKQTGDIADNAYLRPDGANLAALLYLLRERHRHYYEQIAAAIRLVAPFFGDFVLRPSPLNDNKIQLEWRERGSDMYCNAHMLSDGTLRFMCLATLLLQPNLPATVLIDEPELGLHPYAITLLAGMLQSAAVKTQVIISTQSAALVNQFLPDNLVVVDKAEDGSSFRRLHEPDISGWLEDYSLGELWEKNILGGRP